ncbi:MAG TPA: hypothetical protein PK163_04280, partial [Steroidobacteraceae bacterium]|nr:hypothetical protein [Steroidobacteraceae bacterium]
MERTLGPDSAWHVCDDGAVAELHDALCAFAPVGFAHARIVSARCRDLSFYHDHRLVDASLEGVPGIERALLLQGRNDTAWLDGRSLPIHGVNSLESLELDESTVLDYVRFFVFTIRGEHGAFTLIEAADEITLAEVEPAAGVGSAKTPPGEEQLASVRAEWFPLRMLEGSGDGKFRVQGTVAYLSGLFAATFMVEPDGTIEMVEDRPLTSLEGFAVPAAIPLKPHPTDLVPSTTKSALLEALRAHAQAAAAPPATEAERVDDRGATETAVSVLLSEAVRASLGHRLLQRFNSHSQSTGPIGQLGRFLREFAPIIIIESEIPFVE